MKPPFGEAAACAHLREVQFERRDADVLVSARGAKIGVERHVEDRDVEPHEAGDRPRAEDDERQAGEQVDARENRDQQPEVAAG